MLQAGLLYLHWRISLCLTYRGGWWGEIINGEALTSLQLLCAWHTRLSYSPNSLSQWEDIGWNLSSVSFETGCLLDFTGRLGRCWALCCHYIALHTCPGLLVSGEIKRREANSMPVIHWILPGAGFFLYSNTAWRKHAFQVFEKLPKSFVQTCNVRKAVRRAALGGDGEIRPFLCWRKKEKTSVGTSLGRIRPTCMSVSVHASWTSDFFRWQLNPTITAYKLVGWGDRYSKHVLGHCLRHSIKTGSNFAFTTQESLAVFSSQYRPALYHRLGCTYWLSLDPYSAHLLTTS